MYISEVWAKIVRLNINSKFQSLIPNQNYLKMVPRRWIVEEWWMAGSVEDRMDIWTMASFSRSDHLRRRGLLRKKWRTLPLRAIRCLSIAIDVGAEKCLKKVLCQKIFCCPDGGIFYVKKLCRDRLRYFCTIYENLWNFTLHNWICRVWYPVTNRSTLSILHG